MEACLKFSKDMIAARKRNNHNLLRKDNSLDIEQIELTGINMLLNNLKKAIKIKKHGKKDN